MEDILRALITWEFSNIEKKYSVTGYRAGIYEYSNKHCVVQHGYGISCWSTALWMLRRCLDAAWPVDERWSRSTPVEQLSESTIIRDWNNSFGSIKNLNEPYHGSNKEDLDIFSLSYFWIEEWVRAVFYSFVAIACHANDREALKTEELAEHARELGLIPLFVFVRRPKGFRLNLLTTMANPSVFKELFDNGFKGNDEYFLSDAYNIYQIYNAAGLHPMRKHRWKTDYRRAKNTVAAKVRKKDG